MKSEKKDLPLNLEEVDKTSGEVVNLDVNSTSTVQPVALMRLGLFVPTLKSTGKSKANRKNVTDATDELIQLSVARSEGYTDVKITGSNGFNTVGQVLSWTAKFNGGSASIDLDYPYNFHPAAPYLLEPTVDH